LHLIFYIVLDIRYVFEDLCVLISKDFVFFLGRRCLYNVYNLFYVGLLNRRLYISFCNVAKDMEKQKVLPPYW